MDNNESEYQRLIEPIEARMIQSIWRLVHDPDDFNDAFQDALAQVWKRLNRIRRHPNPQALILRICINAAYDVLRRRSRIRRREVTGPILEGAADPSPSPAERANGRQQRDEALGAIGRLPRVQAQAALMRFVEGLSYAEIGQTLGCPESTARSHVLRARKRLSQLLAHLAPEAQSEATR